MPIKFIRKSKAPDAAPIQEGALTVPAELTPKERIEAWKDIPPPKAQRQLCVYCERYYLKPCGEKNHQICGNWLFKQGKSKVAV